MNVSIYTSIFNAISNNFDYKKSIDNFCKFVGMDGEVVVAVNDSNDDTLYFVKLLSNNYPQLKVVESHFSYGDNTFDGGIKNVALQHCDNKYPFKIQMDMDEIIQLNQKKLWIEYGKGLLDSEYQALFIPSIDLYGDIKHIRKNHTIGQKWRIHKNGLKRGVWERARLDNGLFNTSLSDSGELLSQDNQLVYTANIISNELLSPFNTSKLNNFPFTLHYGFLDLERRANLGKNFWKEKWEQRSGKQENVATSIEELQEETIEHNLIF